MAPLIPVVAKLLLSLGPTILRKVGKARGGTAEAVAETIAATVEGVTGEPEDKQQTAVAEALRGLGPEQAIAFTQMQVDLEKVKQEGSWRELQIALETVKGDSAARVAELHQSDLYTKQTRPKIARQSWYVAAAYAVLANVVAPIWSVCTSIPLPSVFSWEVFIALAAPAMTYVGVRGFEKWKAGGSR